MCIIKAFSISLVVLRSHLYFCQFMGQNDELYTLTYSLVHYIFLVTYDVSKVKTIEAKEGDTIWGEIEFKGGDLPKATTKWQKESNSSFQGSGTLKIEKLSKHHAGKYIFRVIDAGSGLVRATYTINIWVEISLSLEFEIKILNWIYTEQLKNRSSTEYKEFERHFHKEMNRAYANFTGYQGVEIKELRNGSTHVRYRFKSITVVKSSSQTTTGAKVKASQILINNARDGYIGQLQIDSSPEAMKISAPPPSPENFRLLGVTKDGAHIAWDRPKNSPYFLIKGYNIEYWKFGSSTKKTSKTFKDISIRLSGLEPETSYVARVIAINDNGRGLESDKIDIKTEAKQLPKWAIAVIVIVVFVFLLVIILVFLCYRRRKKRIAAARAEMTMKRLDKMKESYPKSYFNLGNSFTISEKCTVFSRERFALLYEVGSGEFGVVYRGQLLNDNNEFIDCAVKTYKETASDEDVRDLYQELDIMVNLGRHKNLVNVIGACEEPGKRKGRDQLYLLVEFAQHGSLISYLKEHRENPTENPEFELHYMNRLKLAHGVARGMAFLASKRCVHRDLAARNVLLGDRFVAKVADFGLSRDIYETGEYEKTTSGKLPVKWMAIESLEQRKFSLETDVWSFGVLLWEIETKGLMPHGALSFKDLVHKQKEGYRLEQPAGTPDKLYRLMGICWSADPKKRPTFSQLCKLLDVLKTEQKQEEHRLSSANSLTKKTVGLQLESPGESFNSAM